MGKTAYHFISPICTQLESLADGHQLQCIPLYDPTASPPQTSIVGTLLTLAKKLRERERVMSSSESESSQQGRHQEVGHKSLLQSDALYQARFFDSLPIPSLCAVFHLLRFGSELSSLISLLAVHAGDHRLPSRARMHERTPRDHRRSPLVYTSCNYWL